MRATLAAMAVAAAATLTAVLGPGPAATPAAAHTRVVGTLPADGTTVDVVPSQVEIFFDSKPVTIEGDPVQVYAPSGDRVDDGLVRITGENGTALAVGLPRSSRLPAGEYQVVYRIVSRDTHLIAGRTSFHAREPAGAEPGSHARRLVAPTPDRDLDDGCAGCRQVPASATAAAGAVALTGAAARARRRRSRQRRARRRAAQQRTARQRAARHPVRRSPAAARRSLPAGASPGPAGGTRPGQHGRAGGQPLQVRPDGVVHRARV